MTVIIRSWREKQDRKLKILMLALKPTQWERPAKRFPCLSPGSVTAQEETTGVSSYHPHCNDWRIPGFLWILLEILMDVLQDA